MQNTPIYGFNKPQLTDLPDITKVSSNFDIVEDELSRQEILNGDIFSTINAVHEELKSKQTPFTVNTGTLNSSGNEAILSFANAESETTNVAFVQPILTSNGSLGESSFAVSANRNSANAYLPFSQNSTTEWEGTGFFPTESEPTTLTIYNPNPILLKRITLQNSQTQSKIWSKVRIHASNYNSAWEVVKEYSNGNRTPLANVNIDFDLTARYRYFRLSFIANVENSVVAVKNISINGTISVTYTGGRVIYNGSVIATTANGKTFTADNIPAFNVNDKTARNLIAYIRSNGTPFVSEKTLYRQDTQPSNPQTGVMWFKTLEPFNSYEYNGTSWVETNIVPVGEVAMDGSGKVTAVTTYKYNQNGISVNTRSIATQSLAGVMRVAAVADETNCNCEDAAITPASLYDLANYRKASTAYNVDDSVACPYHANMVLVCIQAGTTAATALDTHDIGLNQEITDGTVKWKTKSTIGNREYFVESDWNYSASLAKQVVELTSVRPVIAVYKKTGTNTYTMVTNVDVDVNGNGVQSIKAISKFEGYVLTV